VCPVPKTRAKGLIGVGTTGVNGKIWWYRHALELAGEVGKVKGGRYLEEHLTPKKGLPGGKVLEEKKA